MGEEEMLTMLSRRRVKGRGAVGPRVDEPGPYLPAPQAASSHGDTRPRSCMQARKHATVCVSLCRP